MTNSDPPFSGPPSGNKGRRRPLPTIDLEATEVESKPAEAAGKAPSEAIQTNVSSQSPLGSATQTVLPEQQSAEAEASLHTGEDDKRTDTPPPESQTGRTPFARIKSLAWLPPNGPWPLLGAAAAGGLAVLVGFLIAGPGSGSKPANGTLALDMRLVRVEQQIRDLADRPLPAGIDPKTLEDVASRLAKLETAVAAARGTATDPALANRIALIEGQVKATAETVELLGRRSDEVLAIARDARQRADANAAGIAELTQRISRLGTAPVARSELEALSSRLAALERSEKAIVAELAKRTAEGAGDRPVRLAIAAAALRAAVERGESFVAELAMAKSLAADAKVLSPLEPFAAAGVPSTAVLARELSELAPALYQAAGTAPRAGTFLERLAANAERLVRIRPIEEVPGDEPANIVARIELKAVHSDLAGALLELAKLPANVRAPAEAWIKKAEARAVAIESSRRLAADALAALGK